MQNLKENATQIQFSSSLSWTTQLPPQKPAEKSHMRLHLTSAAAEALNQTTTEHPNTHPATGKTQQLITLEK